MNTSDRVTAYRLTVFDMENNIIYKGNKENFAVELFNGDTGFIELSQDIGLENGKDYKWIARLYQPDKNMLITYGNVIEPTTYVHTVGSSGLPIGDYYCSVNGKDYVFTTAKALVSGDTLSFDSSDNIVTQRQTAKDSTMALSTTEINSENFQTLTMTRSSSTYTYTVGTGEVLLAGDYRFIISNKSYWFTTLSDLRTGDYITYNATTNKLTQTKKVNETDVTTPLSNFFLSGSFLNLTQAYNTVTKVYLKQNINIKDGMQLIINGESKEIYSYDVNTGLAIVNSPFSSIPTSEDRYDIYSDFIETTPENMLYARALPVVTISNPVNPITSKEYTFKGTYTQSNDVPLVYFRWELYSIENSLQTLITATPKTYSANIEFYYDGFKNSETYNLVLVCENEYGIEREASTIFSVMYDVLEYETQPKAEQTNEQGIRISWMTTIDTEPYSLYTKNATGYIQSDANTASTIWLEREQDIAIGATIKVGTLESIGIVASYNRNTGYTTLSTPLSYVPRNGDYYYIYAEPNYELQGIDILPDTPYDRVNTAKLNDNYLIYERPGGMAEWEDDYQLTMQFLLDSNFFYGDNSVYNGMSMIARYEGNDLSGLEDLLIFAREYNFCAITPSYDDGGLIAGTITAVEADGSAIYISDIDIDLNKQRYIGLVESSYIEYIQDYDSETNKITFGKPLPSNYIPTVGSYFFLYDTLEVAYYDSPNNVFCVQDTNIVNPYNDYIWSDAGVWNDNYYWLEGGTPIGRATNTWWKLKVTPKSIIVQRGGV